MTSRERCGVAEAELDVRAQYWLLWRACVTGTQRCGVAAAQVAVPGLVRKGCACGGTCRSMVRTIVEMYTHTAAGIGASAG